ncbi:hypothetical protein [Streptomyces sp. NPDC005231]|uniref:hypothetical protein n=1 Tax=Streptomyces sp. NPDC005231 TaxID=3157026 RepID=UPI0033AEC7C1
MPATVIGTFMEERRTHLSQVVNSAGSEVLDVRESAFRHRGEHVRVWERATIGSSAEHISQVRVMGSLQ